MSIVNLKNPFSNETRTLFLYVHACLLCGSNGNGRGGLEINHTFGRVSDSPYNASVLCHECHSHVGHTDEEHAKLFLLNSVFLASVRYNADDNDRTFIDSYVIPLYPVIRTFYES